jgi:hypothetical protein
MQGKAGVAWRWRWGRTNDERSWEKKKQKVVKR